MIKYCSHGKEDDTNDSYDRFGMHSLFNTLYLKAQPPVGRSSRDTHWYVSLLPSTSISSDSEAVLMLDTGFGIGM